jgi:hypothetical protein
MTKRKKKQIDKALRKALSDTLRSQPDPAPGWTPGESEILGQRAVETAHGAPTSITPLTLDDLHEETTEAAPQGDTIDSRATKNKA